MLIIIVLIHTSWAIIELFLYEVLYKLASIFVRYMCFIYIFSLNVTVFLLNFLLNALT